MDCWIELNISFIPGPNARRIPITPTETQQASQQDRPQPEQGRTNWVRIGAEITIALVLMFVIFRFFINPSSQTLTLTPTPVNPNIPVGSMSFTDVSNPNDKISFILPNLPQPETNTHYEACSSATMDPVSKI